MHALDVSPQEACRHLARRTLPLPVPLQGTHRHFYLPLGVCAVTFFCALPPVACFATVWSKRATLLEPHVKQVFGFLYDRYRCERNSSGAVYGVSHTA